MFVALLVSDCTRNSFPLLLGILNGVGAQLWRNGNFHRCENTTHYNSWELSLNQHILRFCKSLNLLLKKKKVKIRLLFLIANEYIENVPHSLWEIKACLIEAHFHTISWCSSHFRHFQILFTFLEKKDINPEEMCLSPKSSVQAFSLLHFLLPNFWLIRWKTVYFLRWQ